MAQAKAYEYPSPTKLNGMARRFVKIPESIIYESNVGDKLVTAFSFFSVRKGLDDKAMFSLHGLIEWSGKSPSKSNRGSGAKIIGAVDFLEMNGWISLNRKMSGSKLCVADVNMDKIDGECNDKYFSIVYIDEIEKILSWQSPNSKDAYMSSDLLLRVFSYIRLLIRRRKNKVGSGDDMQSRRLKYPEVWNAYYNDMADDLGITPRAMSSAVDELCDMGLLYTEALPRVKIGNHWVTNQTLFCNAYKREGDMLLASGREYYMEEIRNKKKLLNIVGGN